MFNEYRVNYECGKLSGYRPLTYSGQKKLCEEFDLKLLDSTNCIRGDIPVKYEEELYVGYRCGTFRGSFII